LQHLIALLLAGDFFVALFVHRCRQPDYFTVARKVQTACAYSMRMVCFGVPACAGVSITVADSS
jgi:hypothetical protein